MADCIQIAAPISSLATLNLDPLKGIPALHVEEVYLAIGFLDLPREIRDQIYYILFHSDVPIYPSKSRAGISEATGLLRTNRQVYTEAIEVLYGTNTFQIRGTPGFKAPLLLNLLSSQRSDGYNAGKSSLCLARHHLKRLYIPSHGINLLCLKHLFSLLKHFPNLDYLDVVFVGSSGLRDMDVVSVCRLLRDRRPMFAANFGHGNLVLRKRISYSQAEDISWMVRERPYRSWTAILEDKNRAHVWKNEDGFERIALVVDAPQNLPE